MNIPWRRRRVEAEPPKPRRVIYLVASSGHPNYGDEIIVRQWLRHLAVAEPDAEIWLDCSNPGPTAVLMRDLHPNLRCTDTLYRLCWQAPSDDPREVARFVRSELESPTVTARWVGGMAVVRSASVFHILGGGYINTIWPRHLGLVAAAGWVAREMGAAAVASGLGLLPADEAVREVWAAEAPSFARIGVRDRPSAELLAGVERARLGADDVFLGGLGHLYDPDASGAPEFMVCVQTDFLDERFDAVAAAVRRTLVDWGAKESTVGVVECIPGIDRQIYEALLPEFPDTRFYSLWEVLERGFPAAAHQTWISSRYHPHILASAAGARGLAFSVRRDYYSIKHRAVAELGSGWTVLDDLPDGVTTPGGPGDLPGRAADHAARAAEATRDIYPEPGNAGSAQAETARSRALPFAATGVSAPVAVALSMLARLGDAVPPPAT